MSAFDDQVGGSHYKGMKIQPIEYAMANNLGPGEFLVLRYISRWQDKGGTQDLEKALHVLRMMVEYYGKGDEQR